MTTAQAAELLGCSRRHITLLIRTGHLPAERLSPRVTLLKRADVEAYAAQEFPRGWKRGRPRKPAPEQGPDNGN